MRPNTWRNFLDCDVIPDPVEDRDALLALAEAIEAWLCLQTFVEYLDANV